MPRLLRARLIVAMNRRIQDGGAGADDGGGGIQDGGMYANDGGRVCGIMRGNYDKPNGKRKCPCIMRG